MDNIKQILQFNKDKTIEIKIFVKESEHNLNNICGNCPNNSKNGGSGMCICSLPDLFNITY
ncbi:hypothetical protein [Thermosipho sp. (in: thermotogales)]|jgi:hypothetical protein|uniref:hypothetical protein n=1 Tax=Thermosipho sp. (in: thermotogales) TaxID=1968895 RepID=UPI00257C6FDE|nr:hypothetical protein [Thermosipho sp. (in: thermotogales)]MBZ4649252.1 hypothetical protein [Thermosipho sp. (in: thermotogales)]